MAQRPVKQPPLQFARGGEGASGGAGHVPEIRAWHSWGPKAPPCSLPSEALPATFHGQLLHAFFFFGGGEGTSDDGGGHPQFWGVTHVPALSPPPQTEAFLLFPRCHSQPRADPREGTLWRRAAAPPSPPAGGAWGWTSPPPAVAMTGCWALGILAAQTLVARAGRVRAGAGAVPYARAAARG